MVKLKGLKVVGTIQLKETQITDTKRGSLENLIYKTAKRCFVNKKNLAEMLELSELGVPEVYLSEHRINFLLNFPVDREAQKRAFLAKQQVQKDAAANIRKFGAAFKR